MCPFHILFLVSFRTFSFSISPQDLEHFLVHLALLQDTVLPERADCAIQRAMNLEVSLEAGIDFTCSAMHMLNEEKTTLLLCCHCTHLSLLQEYDNDDGRYYYQCS